jgi:hypothetical protein
MDPEGESFDARSRLAGIPPLTVFLRRVTFLGTGAQMGGKFLPKLNMDSRPIA